MNQLSERATNICKIGQGAACCRYLVVGEKGLECAKLVLSLKRQIDERVNKNLFTAVADNCEGIPMSETI